MELKEILVYIAPYVKMLSKKGTGAYLLLDNVLIFSNSEDSQMLVAELPQQTATILCMDKKLLFDIIDENIDINTVNLIDYSLYYPLFKKYKELFFNQTAPVVSIDNLENIEEVQGFIKMKAKDPLMFYEIDDTVLLPFFYGIIPATKSDKINMKLYPSDNISSIVEYIITRNKPKCIVHVYMRLMNMYRR